MSKEMNIPSMENVMALTAQFVRERHEARAHGVMLNINGIEYSRDFERIGDLGPTQRVRRGDQYCDKRRYAVKGTFTLNSGTKKFRGHWFGCETVTVYPDGSEHESWIQPDSEFVDVYGVRYHIQ